jgi:uncharacterized protein
MAEPNRPFWEKSLSSLSDEEWEALCDGCGRCCLKKVVDDETEQTHYTRVVCRYFREESSDCGCYKDRRELVPDCLNVREMDLVKTKWMPSTCAYRLRFDGKPLFDWHPLIAGGRDMMDELEISISGRAVSEEYVHPEGLDEHVIKWVES